MKTKLLSILFLLTSSFTSFSQTISGGGFHSLSICTDGTLRACGLNSNGQLGDNTLIYRITPVQVSGITNVIGIAAGRYHSLALKSNGSVWAWGWNSTGQLGDGTFTQQIIPVQVTGLTGAVSISAGDYHSFAITSSGIAWAWGNNDHGQLGDGSGILWVNTPVQVSGLTNVIAITGGRNFSLALLSNGTVWAWGENNHGQLGDGTNTDKHTPIQVPGLTGVVSIAAGGNHSLAVESNGTVWTWGENNHGQLGDGTSMDNSNPIQVSGITTAITVSAGFDHCMTLKSNGQLWAWGGNGDGQLGDNTTLDKHTPVIIAGLFPFAISGGKGFHSMMLKSDGTVWTWGSNIWGQLGIGSVVGSPIAVQMLSPCSIALEVKEINFGLNNFILNPNPSAGQFFLQFNSKENQNKSIIEIYNSLGQSIFRNSIAINEGDNQKEIDLSKFPSGIYFLKLKTEKETYRQKIIKE